MRHVLWVLLIALWPLSPPVLAAEDTAGLFRQQCSACHGRDGQKTAKGKARPLASLEQQEIIEQLTTRRDRPGKGGGSRAKRWLTDEEITALAGWLAPAVASADNAP